MKRRVITRDRTGTVVSDVTAIVAGLGADKEAFAANGVAFATFNYAGPEAGPHAWVVNGATTSVPATLDAPSGLISSDVEVTATAAGPVEIVVNGVTLTLQAV